MTTADADLATERAAGLQAQLTALDAWLAQGESQAGWKVGLTSGAARDSMGPGFRPFGFVLDSRAFESPARISLPATATLGVENELCFVIGEHLAGAVSAADARAAVSGVAPAFEIIERRPLRVQTTRARLADNLAQWGIVTGPVVAVEDVDFEGLEVALICDGETVGRVAARGHIDDHFASLAAVAAELARHGRALEPGQRIITGSFAKRAVHGPSQWRGEFGSPFAPVEVSFE